MHVSVCVREMERLKTEKDSDVCVYCWVWSAQWRSVVPLPQRDALLGKKRRASDTLTKKKRKEALKCSCFSIFCFVCEFSSGISAWVVLT